MGHGGYTMDERCHPGCPMLPKVQGVVGGIRDWRHDSRRMAVKLRRRVRLYSIILPLSSVYLAALVVVLLLSAAKGRVPLPKGVGENW